MIWTSNGTTRPYRHCCNHGSLPYSLAQWWLKWHWQNTDWIVPPTWFCHKLISYFKCTMQLLDVVLYIHKFHLCIMENVLTFMWYVSFQQSVLFVVGKDPLHALRVCPYSVRRVPTCWVTTNLKLHQMGVTSIFSQMLPNHFQGASPAPTMAVSAWTLILIDFFFNSHWQFNSEYNFIEGGMCESLMLSPCSTNVSYMHILGDECNRWLFSSRRSLPFSKVVQVNVQ